jgi:hypothetical protein
MSPNDASQPNRAMSPNDASQPNRAKSPIPPNVDKSKLHIVQFCHEMPIDLRSLRRRMKSEGNQYIRIKRPKIEVS